MGHSRPGDMGFDIVHVNLHKSFSQPHGGGGPGAGPIAVSERIEPFLPRPQVVRRESDNGGGPSFDLDFDRPKSIGRLRGFQGNFGVFVRSYAYILSLGADGLAEASETAVLNANYLKARLAEGRAGERLPVAFDRHCMHEFVLSGKPMKKELGLATLDLAKRLLDFGFHPPTVYFPLLVEEALMVEPTETETKESLDAFADAVEEILAEAEADPEVAKSAPYTTPVRRLDEVRGHPPPGRAPAAGVSRNCRFAVWPRRGRHNGAMLPTDSASDLDACRPPDTEIWQEPWTARIARLAVLGPRSSTRSAGDQRALCGDIDPSSATAEREGCRSRFRVAAPARWSRSCRAPSLDPLSAGAEAGRCSALILASLDFFGRRRRVAAGSDDRRSRAPAPAIPPPRLRPRAIALRPAAELRRFEPSTPSTRNHPARRRRTSTSACSRTDPDHAGHGLGHATCVAEQPGARSTPTPRPRRLPRVL